MLPTESSAPNLCYLPVLRGGIPLAIVQALRLGFWSPLACRAKFQRVGRCPKTASRLGRLLRTEPPYGETGGGGGERVRYRRIHKRATTTATATATPPVI